MIILKKQTLAFTNLFALLWILDSTQLFVRLTLVEPIKKLRTAS